MAIGVLALASIAEAGNIHGIEVSEQVVNNPSVINAVNLFRKRVAESGRDIQGKNLDCGLDIDTDYGLLWEACEDVKASARIAQLEQTNAKKRQLKIEQARRIENQRENISQLQTKNAVLIRQVEALRRIRQDFEALKAQGEK